MNRLKKHTGTQTDMRSDWLSLHGNTSNLQ